MNDHGVVAVIPPWLFPVANRALPVSTPGVLPIYAADYTVHLGRDVLQAVPSTNTVASLVLIRAALGIVLIEAAQTYRRRSSSLTSVAIPSELWEPLQSENAP
jgi:EamA domain-containing membrane protein RarD